MKQWNTCFGHVNTLRDFDIDDIDAFVKLKLLQEFSIKMRNIIFDYFDFEENNFFIINLIIFLS